MSENAKMNQKEVSFSIKIRKEEIWAAQLAEKWKARNRFSERLLECLNKDSRRAARDLNKSLNRSILSDVFDPSALKSLQEIKELYGRPKDSDK